MKFEGRKNIFYVVLILTVWELSCQMKPELEKEFDVMKVGTKQLAQTGLFSDALVTFVGGLMNRGPPEKKDYYRMKGLEANKHSVEKEKLRKMDNSPKSALTKAMEIITPKTTRRHNLRHVLPYEKIKNEMKNRETVGNKKKKKKEKFDKRSEIIIMKKDGRSIVAPLIPKQEEKKRKRKLKKLSKSESNRWKMLKAKLMILKSMKESIMQKLKSSKLKEQKRKNHMKKIESFDDDLKNLMNEKKSYGISLIGRMKGTTDQIKRTGKMNKKLKKSLKSNLEKMKKMLLHLEKVSPQAAKELKKELELKEKMRIESKKQEVFEKKIEGVSEGKGDKKKRDISLPGLGEINEYLRLKINSVKRKLGKP